MNRVACGSPAVPASLRGWHGRSRIRPNPGVFVRLRSFGFNIFKANRTNTLSQDRYRAALAGVDNLLDLLAIS